MKFFHLSDLHIGLRLYEHSMLDEQEYILNQIVDLAAREEVDGVLIAGDIYDKSVPPASATVVFDTFLTRLAGLEIPVYLISVNHDSAERISFGAELMRRRGVYISRPYEGAVEPISLTDAYGELDLYLLPYIRPSDVRSAHEGCEAATFHDAVAYAIAQMPMREGVRRVILTHQFLLGASLGGSEETISVGGTDAVGADLYAPFDYVAAGHIHSPQSVTRPTVRYSGTPLAYSFSENSMKKSITVVELLEKGSVKLSEIPLIPRRPLLTLEGSFDKLISPEFRETINTDAFFEIHLIDGEQVLDASVILSRYYPNTLHVMNKNRAETEDFEILAREEKTPMEYLEELYRIQNGAELDAAAHLVFSEMMREVWEVES